MNKVEEFIEIEKIFINKFHPNYNEDEESVMDVDQEENPELVRVVELEPEPEKKEVVIVKRDRLSFPREFDNEPITKEEIKKIEKVRFLVKVYFNNILKINLNHCLPNFIQYFLVREVGLDFFNVLDPRSGDQIPRRNERRSC
jgi:hypothetical protein